MTGVYEKLGKKVGLSWGRVGWFFGKFLLEKKQKRGKMGLIYHLNGCVIKKNDNGI
jgi:hypothetical protein